MCFSFFHFVYGFYAELLIFLGYSETKGKWEVVSLLRLAEN